MTVDMNSPESLAAWYKLNPRRHAEFLRWALRNWPQFRASIEAARALVVEKSDEGKKYAAA